MILLIDNYDSFTYNLAHYIEETGETVSVLRNDKITVKDIKNKINICLIRSSLSPAIKLLTNNKPTIITNIFFMI